MRTDVNKVWGVSKIEQQLSTSNIASHLLLHLQRHALNQLTGRLSRNDSWVACGSDEEVEHHSEAFDQGYYQDGPVEVGRANVRELKQMGEMFEDESPEHCPRQHAQTEAKRKLLNIWPHHEPPPAIKLMPAPPLLVPRLGCIVDDLGPSGVVRFARRTSLMSRRL